MELNEFLDTNKNDRLKKEPMAPFIVMWIHIAGVSAWVGGMLFDLFAIRPAIRRSSRTKEENKMIMRIRDGSRTIRWTAIMALIVTGVFNLLYEGGTERIESDWGAILMVKILLAAIAMAMTGVSDFIIYPGSTKHPIKNAETYSRWMADFVLVLTIGILFIGVYLSRT